MLLFFGLSGTGKTTLSKQTLTENSSVMMNMVGQTMELLILKEAVMQNVSILAKKQNHKFGMQLNPGAVLENVVLNDNVPDYDDNSLTENTRVAYPLEFIPGAVIPSTGGQSSCYCLFDSRCAWCFTTNFQIDKEGAMFHFMSGYTSKLAGTERGIKRT